MNTAHSDEERENDHWCVAVSHPLLLREIKINTALGKIKENKKITQITKSLGYIYKLHKCRKKGQM